MINVKEKSIIELKAILDFINSNNLQLEENFRPTAVACFNELYERIESFSEENQIKTKLTTINSNTYNAMVNLKEMRLGNYYIPTDNSGAWATVTLSDLIAWNSGAIYGKPNEITEMTLERIGFKRNPVLPNVYQLEIGVRELNGQSAFTLQLIRTKNYTRRNNLTGWSVLLVEVHLNNRGGETLLKSDAGQRRVELTRIQYIHELQNIMYDLFKKELK